MRLLTLPTLVLCVAVKTSGAEREVAVFKLVFLNCSNISKKSLAWASSRTNPPLVDGLGEGIVSGVGVSSLCSKSPSSSVSSSL
ncbi:hypothetical protein WICPIJ_009000 [Wickerhamomyces pijperi]|uniref:Secreted protein n=1 Tax=Wickerhamomyces pijperi TaxID=599730 RepID=A0A9P8TG20_WICPI|nr:hypothetical protein WICPIJ_009000 [Wickerhamomyces pijperi]